MTHDVELLWFSGCANHPAAREMLEEIISEIAPGTPIRDVDATDQATADRYRFPGSPTIRVDGRDVDPSYVDPGDYTPRCRLYRTDAGLRGLPERRWIEDALRGGASEAANGAGSAGSPSPAAGDRGRLAFITIGATAVCCLPLAAGPLGVVAAIGAVTASAATFSGLHRRASAR